MSSQHVLIFEEDHDFQSILHEQAKGDGLQVCLTSSAKDTLRELESREFDLLLTEMRISEILLSTFLHEIHTNPKITRKPKILVLCGSNSGALMDELKAIGADDFIAKPFERSGLQQKVKSLLQKRTLKAGQLGFGDLVLDSRSFDVFVASERVHLTPNEFKLLQALLARPGEIHSREQLIAIVQGEGIAVVDRAVDTHVFSLRKKLGSYGDCIETVRGSGYRINEKASQG